MIFTIFNKMLYTFLNNDLKGSDKVIIYFSPCKLLFNVCQADIHSFVLCFLTFLDADICANS